MDLGQEHCCSRMRGPYVSALRFSARQWAVGSVDPPPAGPPAQLSLILTFAGFPVTSQAEARPAPAGPRLVTVGQQADIRAATGLPVLVILTGVTPHWGQRRELSAPFGALLGSSEVEGVFTLPVLGFQSHRTSIHRLAATQA